MTDLQQANLTSNPYFRDPRIRQFLIKHGLINRYGAIISHSSSDISLTRSSRKRRTKENASRNVIDQIGGEEARPQTANRKQKSKRRHRSTSRSLSNTRRLPIPPTDRRRSPTRAKSAHHLSRDFGKRFVRRSAKIKSPEKTRCRVTMTYFGPQTTIDYDKSWFQQVGDEIVVMQQHCGGENLTVFKGFVEPQKTFAFDSRRHSEYPFALALYINGLIDCRVSVCCEYKHKKNVPLGGPSGSFAISDVQKVKPCRNCRYERLKKKSKSTISLGLEPSRYRRSVVPRLPLRNPSRSPVPRPRSTSPPTSSTRRSRSPDARRTPSLPPSESDRPRTPTPPLEEDDKRQNTSSHTHASAVVRSPSVSRASTSSPEEDRKRPPTARHQRDSAVIRTKRNSKIKSSAATRTSPLSSKADGKKPSKSSNKHSSSVIRTTHNTRIPSPSISQTSTSSTDEENKKPVIASVIRNIPLVPTGRSSNSQSPNVSRTPTPLRTSPPASDADDKKPPISSIRLYSPVVPTDYTSSIPNPVTSQNKNNTTENYEPDFDESNDDDYRPTSSRFGQPRISDPLIIDRNHGDNNDQPKYSLNSSSSSDSTDDQFNPQSSQISIGKENINVHSRKSSSSSSRKSDPSENEDRNLLSQILSGKNNMADNSRSSSSSTLKKSGRSEDENDQYTPKILNGENNVVDDAQSSFSRRSAPSPNQKIKSELNEKSDYTGFPSTTDASEKEIGENRRISSSSSEDFFGIKRTSTKENNKGTEDLSTDWFQTTSRNDPDDNDQLNLHSPPKTTSWENLFSDNEN